MKPKSAQPGLTRKEFVVAAAVTGASAASVAAMGRAGAAACAHGAGTAAVRWGFLIDLRKCIGCKACAVACKTENDVRLGVFRSSVKELEKGRFPRITRKFLPWLCNHCANPPCIAECPVDEIDASLEMPGGEIVNFKKRATYQRPDGLVTIDQDRCFGCGACVEACPYGVRYLDPVKPAGLNPENNAADKCDLCAHRLDRGIVPSCVNTCQGEARIAGNLNDPHSRISKLIRENAVAVRMPEHGTAPRCFYIGLDPDVDARGRDTR